MKKLNSDLGSGAVEFIIAFSATAFLFLMIVGFTGFAVKKELGIYASYMRSRILKIYGQYTNTMRRACEDNPFWYVKGDEACVF